MAIQQRCRNPRLRLHKATGRGRVILSGQHFYTRAAHDTPEAHEEYLGLLRRWKANGRRPLRELLSPADVLNPRTVRDLVSAYEAHLNNTKKFRKNGSPTSHRDVVSVALRDLAETHGRTPIHRFRKPELIRHRVERPRLGSDDRPNHPR